MLAKKQKKKQLHPKLKAEGPVEDQDDCSGNKAGAPKQMDNSTRNPAMSISDRAGTLSVKAIDEDKRESAGKQERRHCPIALG